MSERPSLLRWGIQLSLLGCLLTGSAGLLTLPIAGQDELDEEPVPIEEPAPGDRVTPSDRVTRLVNVRQSPSSDSTRLGRLEPGAAAALIGSVPRWHEVQLDNGIRGFVSKAWTDVVPVAGLPRFAVHAVDVGTGLALFVQGEDFTLLYDGGSNDDLARGADNRLTAYLAAVAPDLSEIDHLVLSHPHRDHVELLTDVLAKYQVREVWNSGAVNPICGYRAFMAAVRGEPGLKYHTAVQDFGSRTMSFPARRCYGRDLPQEDLVLELDSRIAEFPVPLGRGASMTFLHADGSHHGSFNENSLVVRLDFGGVGLLLMGDAEAGGRKPPAEEPLTDSIEGALLDCCASELAAQVLVVGHHGSTTSSRTAFLDAVGAETFIVSSGPKKYRTIVLPDQVVIDALEDRGTVFRTDLDDDACGRNQDKIGPDADHRAGGCDNVQVTIDATGTVTPIYWRGRD